MSNIVSVKDISFSVREGHLFGRQKEILKSISFDIPRGEFTAYLGPNGAGKTSTFRILCGLAKQKSGSITFSCEDGTTCDYIPGTKLGFLPELPYFFKNLTPRRLLYHFAAMSGADKNLIPDLTELWASKLNFKKILDQKLASCSKGQVQRIGLAQALMHKPDLVILDEPLSGLDPIGRGLVIDVLNEQRSNGQSLIFSSHILNDVEKLCDRAVIVNEGAIIRSGSIDDLKQQSGSFWDTWEIRYIQNGRRLTINPISKEKDNAISSIIANGAKILSVNKSDASLESMFVKILRGKS